MTSFKNHPQSISLKGIINSFKNAFRGFQVLLVHEYNLYIQLGMGLLVTILGFVMEISTVEWMIQSTAIGLVIFSELVNTAVEKIMDIVQPEHDQKVRDIKDMAAASVLFTVAIALTVGSLIYLPKFF